MGARRWRLLISLVGVMLVVAALPALADDEGPQSRTVLFEVSPSRANGNEYQPAVDSNLVAGNALVVWADDRSGNLAIWGRLVSLAGVPLGRDFRISPRTDGNAAYQPAVAYNWNANEYLVVWTYEWSAGDTDIVGQRVRANGSLAGRRLSIAGSTDNQDSPDVAFNTWKNQYLVVWADDTNPTSDIFGRRFRANGRPMGSEIGVATAANGATGHDYDPAVVFNWMKNTYQVVWTDGRYGSSDYDIFGQRLRANGRLARTSFGVSMALANQWNPDIAFDSYDQEFYVVWSDARNASIDIYGQLLSSNGRLRGGQRRIGLGGGDDWDPVVSSSDAGSASRRYLVAWTDTRYDPDWDINGRYVNRSGRPQGTSDFMIEGETHPQYGPAMPIVSDVVGGDTYLIVWVDERGPNQDIWGRTFP